MTVIRGKLFTEWEIVTLISYVGDGPWFDSDSDEFEKLSLRQMLEREGLLEEFQKKDE